MTLEAPSSTSIRHDSRSTKWSKTVTDPADAAARTGVYDVRGLHGKLFKFANTSDQNIVVTIESVDDEAGTDPRTVGSTVTVAATTGTDEVYISDAYQFLQIKYDPASAATGDFVIKLHAQRAGGS